MPERRIPPAADVVWLIALTLWTAIPRLPGLEGGLLGDEVSLLRREPLAIWTEPFTGTQPPLWRVLLSMGDSWAADIALGRRITFAASLGVLWAMHAVLRRATGSFAVAALAGLAWASLKLPGWVASVARVYPSWSLLALLHLLALMAWAKRPGPAAAAGLAATALGMAQLHYLALPYLFVLGLAAALAFGPRWRTLLCYAPSALSVLPFVPAILSGEGHRREAGLGVFANARVLLDSTDGPPWSAVGAVAALLLLGTWRTQTPERRAVGLAVAAVLAASLAAGAMHDYVTWDAILVTPLLLVGGAAALGDAATRLKLPAVAGMALLAATVGPTKVFAPPRVPFPPTDGSQLLAAVGPAFEGPVAVYPSWVVQTLLVTVQDEPPSGHSDPACGGTPHCFERDGQRWSGVDLPGWTPRGRTLLLIEERMGRGLAPAGCRPHPEATETAWLFVCEPTGDPRRDGGDGGSGSASPAGADSSVSSEGNDG